MAYTGSTGRPGKNGTTKYTCTYTYTYTYTYTLDTHHGAQQAVACISREGTSLAGGGSIGLVL